jgi:hypothetical protein
MTNKPAVSLTPPAPAEAAGRAPAPVKIDELLVRVVQVFTLSGGQQLTNATGFFYLQDGYLHLITNRHVVINEPTGHRPDGLALRLHLDANELTKTNDIQLPLYDQGAPLWKEHPRHGAAADVVAVPINDPQVMANHFVSAFRPEDVLSNDQGLPIGQDVLILGFPLGFHDTVHNLAIVRNATIASVYPVPFKGEPYFLTDARLHRGTSGSPVIAKLPKPTGVVGEFVPAWHVLGVHSASLDVSNRDPSQDEPLGLNCAWYAALLAEIVAAPRAKLPTGAPPASLAGEPIVAEPKLPEPNPRSPDGDARPAAPAAVCAAKRDRPSSAEPPADPLVVNSHGGPAAAGDC